MTPVVNWDDANSEAGNSDVVSEPETDVDADREDAAMASASSASVAAPNATGIVVPIRLDHTYTEYCGSHIFENGVLTMTLFPGGYVSYESGNISSPTYHFYLCDHQGNIRVVTDMNRNIEQVNDYTPFGVLMKNDITATSTQRYKYNGKELDRMHGLDLYYYGARLFDSPLGRWHVMDPLCEKYYNWSPYAYCLNNPVKFVDPDGRIVETAWDIANVVIDVGVAIYNHAKGNHEEAQNNWFDAGADLLAAVIPCIPAGSTKAIRASKKNVNFIAKTVHGNSKTSTNAQHVYRIFDSATNKTVKVGISGGKVSASGKSYRAQSQVRQFNKVKKGKRIFDSEIIENIPKGRGARKTAIKKEEEYAKRYREELEKEYHKIP